VPLVLKDLVCHTAGDPFHEGMRFLRDLGWVEREDTYLAAKLRAAGFVFVGRTNVPERGLLATTEPEAYGPTRNPWDPTRSAGGSSGGSAAAVAAGLVPLAHASDGGGSIRVPASECGLVGLKPSRGRTSLGPDFGDFEGGLAVEHALTRTVRDTAALLDAVAGPMPGDPYTAPPPSRPFREEVGADPGRLRVGLLTRAPGGFAEVHPDCVAAAEDAARMLESLGHAVEDAHPEVLDDAEGLSEYWASVGLLFGVAVASTLERWSRRTGRPIGPGDVELRTWSVAEMGRSCAGTRLLETTWRLQAFSRRFAGWWARRFDLLLTPTLAEPPPRLGEFVATRDQPLAGLLRAGRLTPFTAYASVTGQPAISLPLFWNAAGLPIGVQLVAAYGREDLLLRVAAQLEAARPWAGRVPRVSALRGSSGARW
jgi:amidase